MSIDEGIHYKQWHERIPGIVKVAYGLALLSSLVTANAFLTLLSLLLLPLMAQLLWVPGHPPLFAFCLLFQWLQASIKVFHANFHGIDIRTAVDSLDPIRYTFFYYVPGHGLYWAVLLSLIGVGVLAVAISVSIGSHARRIRIHADHLDSVSTMRLFMLYAFVFVVAFFLKGIAFSFGGLTQIIFGIITLKVALGFVLMLKLIYDRRIFLTGLVVVVELVIGFTGYFADFKTIFFLLVIAMTTVYVRISSWKLLLLVSVLFVTFLFGAVWTAVKADYRSFMTGGVSSQSIDAGYTSLEKLQFLEDLVGDVDSEELLKGVDDLILRISYVDFFAASLEHVPSHERHTEGDVWLGAIANLVPRLFYPDKPILPSDTEHTMYYTGMYFLTGDSDTSFSIGYMGDSYIDFGMFGMFIPIFMLGVMYGWMYRQFVTRDVLSVLAFGFAAACLLDAYQLEIASVKLLGRFITNFLVLRLILGFGGKAITAFLLKKPALKDSPRQPMSSVSR